MSATVPNVEELAMWLHADCYRSDFRPVDTFVTPTQEIGSFGRKDQMWKEYLWKQW